MPRTCQSAVIAASRAREAVKSMIKDETSPGFMYRSRRFGCIKGNGLGGLKSSEVRSKTFVVLFPLFGVVTGRYS